MNKCSNCGMECKHLLGPQRNLCDKCLEFIGPALDSNNYPNQDNTLKDLDKEKNKKKNIIDYVFYFGIKTIDGRYTNEHIELFDNDPKRLEKWVKLVKNLIKLIKEAKEAQ